VKVYTSTFDATTEAVDDLHWLFGGGLEILDVRWAVRGTFAVGSFWLRGCFFAVGLVDVSSGQRLGLAFCGRLLARGAVGSCELFSICSF
jgi:hypothetical protein